jgi:hypothetical protein
MRIDIKIVRLDGSKVVRRLRTEAHRRLTPVGINAMLRQEADRVEQFFPGLEFRLVPLRGGNFNFVEIPAEMASAGQTA